MNNETPITKIPEYVPEIEIEAIEVEPVQESAEFNPILATCLELEQYIKEYGKTFQNTKEAICPSTHIVIKDLSDDYILDLDKVERDLRENYYGAEKYDKRLLAEKFHYEQLRYALLHKVEELHYFHNTALENRKTVIFSNDCISSIQYLKRGREALLIVHMRSSDVEALLPMDLLYLAKLLREVGEYYTSTDRVPFEELIELETIHLTIGSAHVYTSGGRDEE